MKPTPILTIAWHEYVTHVRQRGFIVFVMLPVVFILACNLVTFIANQLYAQTFDELLTQLTGKFTIGIVDQTQQFAPAVAAGAKRFKVFDDADAANRALRAEELVAVAIIPAGYPATGQITLYRRNDLFSLFTVNFDSLRGILLNGLLKDKVDARTRASFETLRAVRLTDISALEPQTESATSEPPLSPTRDPALLTLAFSFGGLIFIAAGYLLQCLHVERSTRILEIVLSSITPRQLLMGKTLGLSAVGFTPQLIWWLLSFVWQRGVDTIGFGASVAAKPSTFLLTLCYFFLGYLLFAAILSTLGAVGASLRDAQLITFLCLLPPLAAYYFAYAAPASAAARFFSIFPLTAPFAMMMRLSLGAVSWVDITLSLSVLSLTMLCAWWLGAQVLRLELLLHGKTLSFRELVRRLRAA